MKVQSQLKPVVSSRDDVKTSVSTNRLLRKPLHGSSTTDSLKPYVPARTSLGDILSNKSAPPAAQWRPVPLVSESTIKDLQSRLSYLTRRLESVESGRLSFPESETEPGILYHLHMTSDSPSSRQFQIRQSSAALTAITDPESGDYYGTPDAGDAWIDFHFDKPIEVSGFFVQSFLACYPGAFRIIAFDSGGVGTSVWQTKGELELQGEMRAIERFFAPVKTSHIRFEQMGPSFNGRNHIGLKRLDFISDGRRLFESGTPVFLRSRYFDPVAFVYLRPISYVCTFDAPAPSWFEIELARPAIVTGCRMRRCDALPLKGWKLVLYPSQKVLVDASEERECELRVFHFESATPSKIYRIEMTEPGWTGRYYLAFSHFELFGELLPREK